MSLLRLSWIAERPGINDRCVCISAKLSITKHNQKQRRNNQKKKKKINAKILMNMRTFGYGRT